MEVIADLLGISDTDRDGFPRISYDIRNLDGPLATIPLLLVDSKFKRFVRRIVQDLRTTPLPGLVTDLLLLADRGEQLRDDELVSIAFLLIFTYFSDCDKPISFCRNVHPVTHFSQ